MAEPSSPSSEHEVLPYLRRPAVSTEPAPDSRSFTERYRGTEWGFSAVDQVLVPELAAARRGGPSILLILGLGLFMAVLGVVGVILYQESQRQDFPLAGLFPADSPATTERPVASPTTAPATSSPTQAPLATPSSAPASPTPGTRPSLIPALPLTDDPAGAFAARMLRGDATYNVEADGEFEVGNERFSWDYSMDVAGRDLSGVVTMSQKRVRAISHIVVKDGVQYEKLAGESWIRREGPPEGMPADFLSTASGPQSFDGMQYVGEVTRNGRQLHHLRFPAEYVPLLSDMLLDEYQGGLEIDDFSFDLWVTDDGRPRLATMTIDGTARADGMEVDISLDMDYRYSGWGDDIVIEAPERFTDPGYTDG